MTMPEVDAVMRKTFEEIFGPTERVGSRCSLSTRASGNFTASVRARLLLKGASCSKLVVAANG